MRGTRLSDYDLPASIVAAYEKKGLVELYPWQHECLNEDGVLDGKNLVYCAPTSGGKTLVSEILMFRQTQGPMLFILPFISVVSEKEHALRDLAGEIFDVKGFHSGSVERVSEPFDIGVCTIEKANMIVNYLVEANGLHNLKLVVIDEMHLLGDSDRGYLLEVLVAKLLYMAPTVQIIGMSATLPNMASVSTWLQAALYMTDFRPVPLTEYWCKATENLLYDKNGNAVRPLNPHGGCANIQNDTNFLAATVKEVTDEQHSVLVFCSSKANCESTCKFLADRLHIKTDATKKKDPWPCAVLQSCIPRGVSYHHAGLTTEERMRIEQYYRSGEILVLCATSTLAAGVNLPARRVVFNGINIGISTLKPTMYRQMSGRAGRAGQGNFGESVIVAKDKRASWLMQSEPEPLVSCMDTIGLTRLVLEMLCVRPAMGSGNGLNVLANATFLLSTKPPSALTGNPKEDFPDMFACVQELMAKGLVECDSNCYRPTAVGKAVTASAMDLNQGLEVWKLIHQIRSRPLILESDLHVCYLVVPFGQHIPVDWDAYLEVYKRLNDAERKVCESIGVFDHTVERAAMQRDTKCAKTMRLYTALIVFLLSREMDPQKVLQRFRFLSRGLLQSLQRGTVSFTTSLATFCEKLRWWHLEALVRAFGTRLQFGSSPQLVQLLQIPGMDKDVANNLYDDGFINPQKIVAAEIPEILKTLRKTLPAGVNRNVLTEEVAERLVTAAKETAKAQKKDHAAKLREWRSKEKVWKAGQWSSKKVRTEGLKLPNSLSLSTASAPSTNEVPLTQRRPFPNSQSTPRSGRILISLHAREKKRQRSVQDANLMEPKRPRVPSQQPTVQRDPSMERAVPSNPRAASWSNPRGVPLLGRAPASQSRFRVSCPARLSLTPTCTLSSNSVLAGLRKLGRLQMTQRDQDAVSQTSPASIIASEDEGVVASESPARSSLVPYWPPCGDPEAVQLLPALLDDANMVSHPALGVYVGDDNDNGTHNIAVCWGSRGCVVPCITALRQWLSSSRHAVVVENARAFWKLCRRKGVQCKAIIVEPTLLHLLFDPDGRAHTYSQLYDLYKVPRVQKNALVIGRAWALVYLMHHLDPKAADIGVKDVFYELEVPFQPVLFQMEIAGLYVAPNWNTAPKVQYKLSALEDMAREMLGRRLMFHSQDDCGKALFEELCLPPPEGGFSRKDNGKVRYTIPAELLLDLDHPLAHAIWEYRRLSHVLCKYKKLETHARLEPDRRVRSEFARTATGRLVSDVGSNLLCMNNAFDVCDVARPSVWDEMHTGSLPSAVEGPVVITNAQSGPHNPRQRQGWLLRILDATIAEEDAPGGIVLGPYWAERGWHYYNDADSRNIRAVLVRVGNAELSYPADQVWRMSAPISIGQSTLKVNIRDVFTSAPGKTFLSVDYCQVEIRMMAHFSRDPALIAVLKEHTVDIFQSICAGWLAKPVREVTAEERAGTKSLVYGLVYGMGPKRLASKLKVTTHEAVLLIRQFEQAFPRVLTWIRAVQAVAPARGWVESLLGWRRNLSNGKKGERQAINTKCQASATDLMKLAMMRVADEIRDEKCMLVLQMHDELLFEIDDHCVPFFAKKITQLMTRGLVDLKVPLAVKCRTGKTWGNLSDISL